MEEKYAELEKRVVYILNAIGIIGLIWNAIPYIIHDTTNFGSDDPSVNMFAGSQRWDHCGLMLGLIFIPILIINILTYRLLFKDNKKAFGYLCFAPSIICLVLFLHYIIF